MNALLATCGLYDGAGEFAYRVGMPGKSGVGGGIIAIVPGEMSIAVWSPELDPSGNSLAGTAALELLSARIGRSIFLTLSYFLIKTPREPVAGRLNLCITAIAMYT